MSKTTSTNGRLCNQIIRNIATSFIAEKHNLKVLYSSHEQIKQLGIVLYSGDNTYKETIKLDNKNYFRILNKEDIESNIDPNEAYFQTQEITKYIYSYLNKEEVKERIKVSNKFGARYNNNNDIFIHIRLGDVKRYNPGLKYYDYVIEKIKKMNSIENIYICSDTPTHEIIKQLVLKHNCKVKLLNPVETIMFGSTCKYVILSHGSFSAVIGWLSFYSKVYYKKIDKIWHGDLFCIDNFEMINI